MGKKSKSKSKVGSSNGKPAPLFQGNEIPLIRKIQPSLFQSLVDELNPILRFDARESWCCADDDSFWTPEMVIEPGQCEGVAVLKLVSQRKKIRQHGAPATCPLCFKPAYLQCSVCHSVYYCGPDCQKKHWRESHKKACKPNPGSYTFNVDIDQFRSLPKEAFEGHEFLVIKPTEKLSSLAEICEVCLESADDVFEKIPGFGQDQIQQHWVMGNGAFHPIAKAVRTHFGWISTYEVGNLTGWRHSEDHFVYTLMYDDNFLNQTNLAPSYYGDACFPYAREGKHVRGNLVIFKTLVKNKKRRELDLTGVSFLHIGTDDNDLQFEYELYPSTKAEIAHMLQERRTAIEQRKYTRRQWRYIIRQEERAVEINKFATQNNATIL